jgi:hypothetical protein
VFDLVFIGPVLWLQKHLDGWAREQMPLAVSARGAQSRL